MTNDSRKPAAYITPKYRLQNPHQSHCNIAIATRVEKVLPDIINVDQTGYINVRYIGENIRLIQDVLHFTRQTNEKGIAIFLDFKKAIDMIKWMYLNATLELFNFGPDIVSWIK